ncbi:MAG: 50S ribosomal protein L4 [Sedimentisphaerales bacterium]|nr:50S ribosomal protein L4 [Sedimentisphaerales bacterium]
MIELSVYNTQGETVDSLKVDESIFGGRIRYALLKQAIVMYQANSRVGTAATKGRSMVTGSGRKLFRQKGTGSARVGNIRTGKRVGGGVTFAKEVNDFRKQMPKKQRRLARDSAILAKLLSNNAVVIEGMVFERPRTTEFVGILNKLRIPEKDSCLVTTAQYDRNLYKSARNVNKISVTSVVELNAGQICSHRKMLFTKDAFMAIVNKDENTEEGNWLDS